MFGLIIATKSGVGDSQHANWLGLATVADKPIKAALGAQTRSDARDSDKRSPRLLPITV